MASIKMVHNSGFLQLNHYGEKCLVLKVRTRAVHSWQLSWFNPSWQFSTTQVLTHVPPPTSGMGELEE